VLVDRRRAAATGPAFARGLWRIAAADVSSGNRVGLLRDGPATFDAMCAAIEAAQATVVLEAYILRSDEAGHRIGDALIAAALLGVQVRVLSDWIGMRGMQSSFIASLKEAGIQHRVFNPPGLRRWFGLIPRDHRKLLVCDSTVGITGGVGIGNEWLMGKTKRRRSQWRDTAVRIEGPAAGDMQQAFDTMWERAHKRERRGMHRLTRRAARGAHQVADRLIAIDPAFGLHQGGGGRVSQQGGDQRASITDVLQIVPSGLGDQVGEGLRT